MKKFTILCTVLFASVFVLNAQEDTSNEGNNENSETTTTEEVSGPVMTFETKVVDYGEIEENADPYRFFKFENTGTEPLIITSAKGSCGCTVPTYPTDPIGPGESGEIKVRYATNRIGAFTKTVTLTTNSVEEKIVLKIKGKVNKKPAQPDGVPASENNLFKSGNNR